MDKVELRLVLVCFHIRIMNVGVFGIETDVAADQGICVVVCIDDQTIIYVYLEIILTVRIIPVDFDLIPIPDREAWR